jgi:hypothetical protein
MKLKKPRFIAIGLGALGALSLLWSLRAEAANVNCFLASTDTVTGLFTFNHERYSVECSANGLDVVSEARSSSDNSGIQVRLRIAVNTATQVAIANGFNQSQQAIPGCVIVDQTPGLSWETKSCAGLAADDFVKYLTLSANGSS